MGDGSMTHDPALAERNRIIAYLESRADKVARRHPASARQLRVAAGELRAGMHLGEDGDGR